MTVSIRHLNCGTLRPPGSDPMVCHVLLLETDSGLALVDTGFGLEDIERPAARIGGLTRVIRPDFDVAETAAAQVEALGYARSDVTHIVVTHLDSDHSGGIDDFPKATVHVTADEYRSAGSARGIAAAVRYRPWRASSEPRVVSHDRFPVDWYGFRAARLSGIDDDVLLVPLPGHTPGHAGVAVRTGDDWLLHCGDAFYHRAAVLGGSIPMGVRAGQFITAADKSDARATRHRLADAFAEGGPPVRLVCAHDPMMFADAAQGTVGR